jgi:hypothetical protein
VFSFERTEIEIIENALLLTKPRRFNLKLKIKGVVWRKIQVEVGFPEGKSGDIVETIKPMRLDFLGLESVDEIATISLAYQVAQKIHGASAYPLSIEQPNTRVRDVIDLVLISQEIFAGNGTPELHSACVDTFETRGSEIEALGHTPHTWPPTIQAYPTWASEYKIVSERLNLKINMNQAIDAANAWITSIATA